MGGIVFRDRINDTFCQSTKYGEFHNNSSSDVLEKYEKQFEATESRNTSANINKSMQSRVQLSKSKLSWKKDISDFSFVDPYRIKCDENNNERCESFLFNDSTDKLNTKISLNRNYSFNEDKIFNILPITLEIDKVYRSIVVKTGHSIEISPSSIPGAQIEVKKIFNENMKNKSLLNDIEKRFLLIRINQENLTKLPFISDYEKNTDNKSSLPCVSNQLVKNYQTESDRMGKLGFSTIESGRIRYLMFLRASSNNGWKDLSVFQQFARTLIANQRKTGCDIHISDSRFVYRGSEVKPLIIEDIRKHTIQ